MRPETDTYAAIAPWYDRVTAFALRGPRLGLVALCRERRFCRVLDVGCGTGVLAGMLADAGLEVTGLDASPAMLAVAAGRLPPGVPLVCGSVPLPFGDAGFDAVILSLILHESEEEPETILAESFRVAPVCVVLEWRMPERNLDLPLHPLVHGVERLAGRGHYRRFCQFARGGYLRGAAGRAGAVVTAERPVLAGMMTLALVARAGVTLSHCKENHGG